MGKKCYVILIDRSGDAIFGVKALTDPYGSGKMPYTAGCPSLFGGNIDGDSSIESTLVKEALQESHNKIQLWEPVLKMALAQSTHDVTFTMIHQEQDHRNDMMFFILLYKFSELPEPIKAVPAGDPAFRETTGDIVKVNLKTMSNHLSREQVADAVIEAMPLHLQQRIPDEARKQFQKKAAPQRPSERRSSLSRERDLRAQTGSAKLDEEEYAIRHVIMIRAIVNELVR